MGFLEYVKNFFNERFDRKVEKSLERQRNKLQFDPRLIMGKKTIETTDFFTRRIMEYKTWSMGNAQMLRYIYRSLSFDNAGDSVSALNYFWHKAPPTRRFVHSGIPGLISTRMADILFGCGVDFEADVYREENGERGKKDERLSKAVKSQIDTLCDKILFLEKIQTAATNESWGGHCFFKLSYDLSLSQYPILETFDITKCETVKERGITRAIIFKYWYEHGGNDYRLDEIYGRNESGDATIAYKLYRLEKDRAMEVNLLSIPQTSARFSLAGTGAADGVKLDANGVYTYVGLKGMLAFEKPNKTPSMEFPSSNYGASDYEGAIDSFDAADEVYSQNVREIRTNETIRYFPETLLPKDKEGNAVPIDEFSDCYQKISGDYDQEGENKVDYQKIDDKTASYMEKWKLLLSTICNKAKISPFALGITWLEAVNPSADSQRERNKVTIDMRKGKLKLWKPFIENMLSQALRLNGWLKSHADGVYQPEMQDIDLTGYTVDITVSFGEYIEDSVTDKINTWGAAKAQKVASTQECIREIHPDWDSKKIQEEVNAIRFEEGMSTDDPDGLPELDGYNGTGDSGE